MSEQLTAQEQAYFQSQGQAEIPAEPTEARAPIPEEPEKPQQDTSTLTVQPGQGEVTPSEPKDTPETVQQKLNAALRETRSQNRELRNKLAELERAQNEHMQRMLQAQQKLGITEAPPAFEENAAEYLKAEVTQTKAQLEALQQREAMQAQLGQFKTWYAAQAQQFSAQQPDFANAYATYNKGRVEQLMDLGLTEAKAVERLQAEEMQLASTAAQTGLNPAQMLYQIALARGYKPETKPVQPSPSLDTIRKGMEASKPLSAVGGGGKTENLTWEAIAEMPDSEFLSAWNNMMKAEGLH